MLIPPFLCFFTFYGRATPDAREPIPTAPYVGMTPDARERIPTAPYAGPRRTRGRSESPYRAILGTTPRARSQAHPLYRGAHPHRLGAHDKGGSRIEEETGNT